jgi:hypothetical protein
MAVKSQLHVQDTLPTGDTTPPPRYPLDRNLGESQSLCGRGNEKKNLCPCRDSKPGRPTRNLSLDWLQYKGIQLPTRLQ